MQNRLRDDPLQAEGEQPRHAEGDQQHDGDDLGVLLETRVQFQQVGLQINRSQVAAIRRINDRVKQFNIIVFERLGVIQRGGRREILLDVRAPVFRQRFAVAAVDAGGDDVFLGLEFVEDFGRGLWLLEKQGGGALRTDHFGFVREVVHHILAELAHFANDKGGAGQQQSGGAGQHDDDHQLLFEGDVSEETHVIFSRPDVRS